MGNLRKVTYGGWGLACYKTFGWGTKPRYANLNSYQLSYTRYLRLYGKPGQTVYQLSYNPAFTRQINANIKLGLQPSFTLN